MRTRTLLPATLLVIASGCQILGVAADRLVGQRPVDALYSPGEFTPIIVLVENYRDPSINSSDSMRVQRMVGEVLEKKKVANIIGSEKLMLLRDGQPSVYSKMSVVDIGKAVGAHQVLYIDLSPVGVGAQSGSDVMKGRVSASIRVIDVNTGNTVFPSDLTSGYPLEYTSPMRRAASDVTPDTVRGEALVGLSARIARLFYKYTPGDLEALDIGT